MKKTTLGTIFLIFISFLIFSFTFNSTIAKDSYSNYLTLPPTQEVDSLAIEVLQGWMNFIRVIFSEENCLPRNEAFESQLESDSIESNTFVPNMIGYWMLAAVLSYEVKKLNPELTNGFDKQELLDKLYCVLDALDDILENHAFVDTQGTGKWALYQVHNLNGEAPLSNEFEQIVSMLDNVYLVTALKVVEIWSQSVDPILSNKIENTLQSFDISMWLQDDRYWSHGGPMNPTPDGVPVVDRILAEGRMVYVTALARGEIDLANFVWGLDQLRFLSQPYTSPQGVYVEYLPYFGTSLEKWIVPNFLSVELKTKFGCNTLYPVLTAQEEQRCSLNLISNEATGIGDGFYNFLEFGNTPSEGNPPNQDINLLIPPAVMMQAGVMAKIHPFSEENFLRAIEILNSDSLLNSTWGLANYFECETEIVNSDDLLWGTLEIEQGTVALLNMLLGGDYIENLLRQDNEWDNAINSYAAVLDNKSIFMEAEEGFSGDGEKTERIDVAFSDSTLRLSNDGEFVNYQIIVADSGNYEFYIRYANDDFVNMWDQVNIIVNGETKDSFLTENTGNSGNGWYNYLISPPLNLGYLTSGIHELSLSLVQESAGVEFDVLILLQVDNQYSCDYPTLMEQCNDTIPCSIIDVLPSIPSTKNEVFISPNPLSSQTVVTVKLNQPEQINLRVFNSSGILLETLTNKELPKGNYNFMWDSQKLPAGIYYLIVSGDGWYFPKKMAKIAGNP